MKTSKNATQGAFRCVHINRTYANTGFSPLSPRGRGLGRGGRYQLKQRLMPISPPSLQPSPVKGESAARGQRKSEFCVSPYKNTAQTGLWKKAFQRSVNTTKALERAFVKSIKRAAYRRVDKRSASTLRLQDIFVPHQ